jgi:xanthine phosphoribosyltransferase
MDLLKQRIVKDGKVFPGNILKVSGFLNHLIDSSLMKEIGKEVCRLFEGEKITKILTIEASGIAIACAVASELNVPVLFAKKHKSSNVADTVYCAQVKSYTHGNENTVVVEKEYLSADDRVLIVDDFLAHGEALRGLVSLVRQAGATLVGCVAAVEKGYQGGGDSIRAEGVRVESLAIIDEMSEDKIIFRN